MLFLVRFSHLWLNHVRSIDLGFHFLSVKVLPPIPLLSASAESMYYGLQCHPSYRTVHSLTNQIMMCSTIPGLHLHEVDGAYANERLNAHFLSIPGFTGSEGDFSWTILDARTMHRT